MYLLSEYYMFYMFYLSGMLPFELECSSATCILLFHECTGNAQGYCNVTCNVTLQLVRIIVAHIIVITKTHRLGVIPFRICCGSMCLTRCHCAIVFGMNKQVDNSIVYVLYLVCIILDNNSKD